METDVILHGDALATLRTLPSASVHTCVTSPPYWGLRDYGTAQWEGGDPVCTHTHVTQGKTGQRADRTHLGEAPYRDRCGVCGARRVDSQMGLEPTPDCGKHGKFRLRRNLTAEQREYVVRRLLGEGHRDA